MQSALNSVAKTVDIRSEVLKSGSPCPESSQVDREGLTEKRQSIGVFESGEAFTPVEETPVLQKAKEESDFDSSSDSFGSLGSLAELGREIFNSVMRKMDKESDPGQDLSSISGQTDSSEVHSVFKNSGLKIRGIDVDNLTTKDGKKLDIYHLFKARFQLYDTGKTKISNSDVVGTVHMLTGRPYDQTAANFIREGDRADYRKNMYDPKKDANYTKFQELWSQVNKTRQNQPMLPPTLTNK